MEPIVEHVFANAPAGVSQADPATWIDPPFQPGLHNLHGKTTSKDGRSGDWQEQDGPPVAAGRGFFSHGAAWRVMSPTAQPDGRSYGGDRIGQAASGLGAEPWLLKATAHAPNLVQAVETLLGAPVRPAPRTRGIYTLWPTSSHHGQGVSGHVDGRPGQISAMVLVSAVPSHAGGFHVWPGSHRRLFHLWDTSQGSSMSPANLEKYTHEVRT